MNKARSRNLNEYLEKHRELPGCMGGTYDSSNVVKLTPEEHYTAHLLLVKIYPGVHKLVFAAKMMTIKSHKNNGRNNKLYGWMRRKFAERMSIERKKNPIIWTTEMRKAQSERKLGIPGHKQTDETRKKISIGQKLRTKESYLVGAKKIADQNRGRNHSAATRLKMSNSHDRKPRFLSIEAREKISFKMKGRSQSEETKLKVSKKMIGIKKPSIKCPHCSKIGGMPSMIRWHFDNCKVKHTAF